MPKELFEENCFIHALVNINSVIYIYIYIYNFFFFSSDIFKTSHDLSLNCVNSSEIEFKLGGIKKLAKFRNSLKKGLIRLKYEFKKIT